MSEYEPPEVFELGGVAEVTHTGNGSLGESQDNWWDNDDGWWDDDGEDWWDDW